MTDSNEKLTHDLAVLQEMAAQMSDYLKSETLFWPMGHGGMPKLTLGGYWLRQHRLTALHHLLTGEQQAQLSAAIKTFETAVSPWVVRTEQRAHTELAARIRQWDEYLRDLREKRGENTGAYPAQVEVRAIIAALVAQLQQAPYQLDGKLLQSVLTQDKGLRARFASGNVVWPDEWQPAYPEPEFWWLYGRPK
ncbi:hypothetical protein [Candidatus Leptofilum sp.]|uniref:hypothetical protein n=1 Tax=Candidatus Leptofilum sp. TaxID=3241576 RepID=UPI003B5BD44B